MRNRNPIAVLLLPLVTFGIYALYWEVSTKNEMNKLGADIPTAWLLIVPFVNWWWLWKYSQGVEKVTAGKLNGLLTFLLFIVIGSIGAAIVQSSFNEVTGPVAAAGGFTPTAAAPVGPTEPQPPVNTPPTNLVS